METEKVPINQPTKPSPTEITKPPRPKRLRIKKERIHSNTYGVNLKLGYSNNVILKRLQS